MFAQLPPEEQENRQSQDLPLPWLERRLLGKLGVLSTNDTCLEGPKRYRRGTPPPILHLDSRSHRVGNIREIRATVTPTVCKQARAARRTQW